MVFVADNVLRPDVIRAIYRRKKAVDAIVTKFGDSWSDLCLRLPVIKSPDLSKVLGRRRRRRRNSGDSDDIGGGGGNDNFGSLDGMFEDLGDDEFFQEVSETEAPSGSADADVAEYFSVNAYPDPYCKVVEAMETACMEFSILELWASDGSYDLATDALMANLTQEAVLDRINGVNTSGVFLTQRDFVKELLSEVETDPATGRVVGAKATVVRWFGRMNGTDALLNPVKDRGEPEDARTLEFEGDMLRVLLERREDDPADLQGYPNAKRSFGDISSDTILGDVSSLAIGYMILTTYVQIMLGKFNCLENRATLTFAGVAGVIMGIVVSYGLCSLCGLFFGPMHNVLPFLLLGIGIDDMFVIVQCWDTEEHKAKDLVVDGDDALTTGSGRPKRDLPHRVGVAMTHAGTAISITSITDVIAFGIGASTVLPALQSFCIYASVGLLSIFLFQCTFFVAWMTLDQRRVESRRNACCPCFRHGPEWEANKLSSKDLSRGAFKAYGRFLTRPWVKVGVIAVATAVTGAAVAGNVLLEQRFDPTWFLPPDTYLAKWFQATKRYFPFGADRVTVYFSGVDPVGEFDRIHRLALSLEEQTDIVSNVDSWTKGFAAYYNRHFGNTLGGGRLPKAKLTEETFSKRFTQFLFSPRGGLYRSKFVFEGDDKALRCRSPAPPLALSEVTFTHRWFSGPSEHVPAMNRVKRLIGESNVTGKVFPISIGYASWETDEVISHELYRNIGLAAACVFGTTLFLITDLVASTLVMFCVLLSLVHVGGFMHFWGLTIDTVTCVNLIIAIGLCVDYSAHIAHRFMTVRAPSRDVRVQLTLAEIGPAVLNGGVSTFLAFILLARSKSYVFTAFFKVFFLVVVCGLFNGLVVLPVLLSLLGPHNPVEGHEEEPMQMLNGSGVPGGPTLRRDTDEEANMDGGTDSSLAEKGCQDGEDALFIKKGANGLDRPLA